MRHQSILGMNMWLLLPFSCAVSFTFFAALGFHFAWMSVLPTIAIAAAAAAVHTFYTRVRPDDVIPAMVEALAFLFLIIPPLAILEYPTQALNFPLRDAEFAAMDKALGFDWMGHVLWVSNHPWIGQCLSVAYHSCMVQLAAVVIVLSLMKRFDDLRGFLLLFALTAIIVTATATVIPGEGAYTYLKLPASIRTNSDPLAGIWHLVDMRALRAGTLTSVSLDKVEGLISMPSFHVIFAILLAWATRGVRFVFIPASIWNALVCISAIAIGGHYFIDTVTGALIAFVSIYVYNNGKVLAANFAHALRSPQRQTAAQ
jgi:membrane-associated phospholipid phosphatase